MGERVEGVEWKTKKERAPESGERWIQFCRTLTTTTCIEERRRRRHEIPEKNPQRRANGVQYMVQYICSVVSVQKIIQV